MNRIKELRELYKLNQEDLANKLNVSKGLISLYEQEKRKPSLEILIKLSEIFNVSIDYLLGRTNTPNIMDKPIQIAASTKDNIDISELDSEDKKTIENLYKLMKNKKN